MPDCIQYDVGKFVKQHSDAFLKRVNPQTGQVQLDYSKATPRSMQILLDELQQLTDEVRGSITSVQDGYANSEATKLKMQLGHWQDELNGYKNKVRTAVDQNLGPGAIYYCVTAPLFLGWYPNSSCTGVNPNQTQQMVATVGTPLSLLNQALCLREANENAGEWVLRYWKRVEDGLGTVVDAAQDVAKATKSFWDNYKVPVLAGTGLAALFLFLRK